MADEQGKPIAFTTPHDAGRQIFQYSGKFNKPIEPGEAVLYSSDSTMKGLIRKVSASEYEYRFNHNPGSNDTRCFRMFRLPKGAALVAVTPKDLPHRVKDGRVEIVLDKMVPRGGGINAVIRYRLSEGEGL